MKSLTQEADSNIIKVSFGASSDSVESLSQNVLNSLSNELGLEFDPLEDLLNEFEDLEMDDFEEERVEISRSELTKLSVHDNPISMAEILIEQTGIIKTDLEKLNYYLNELSID